MRLRFTLFIPLVFLLFSNQSCTTLKDTKKQPSVAKVLMVPPGLLQFEAESLSYKAMRGFHRWQFTTLNIPHAKKNDLEGVTATIEIDMASVYERTIRLTNDLKSEKYLDCSGHPRAFVEVFNVRKLSADTYICEMTLTMKGFSKTFYSEFKVTSLEPFHINGYADVLRSDFNIQEGELGIPNDIHIVYDTDLAYTKPEM